MGEQSLEFLGIFRNSMFQLPWNFTPWFLGIRRKILGILNSISHGPLAPPYPGVHWSPFPPLLSQGSSVQRCYTWLSSTAFEAYINKILGNFFFYCSCNIVKDYKKKWKLLHLLILCTVWYTRRQTRSLSSGWERSE